MASPQICDVQHRLPARVQRGRRSGFFLGSVDKCYTERGKNSPGRTGRFSVEQQKWWRADDCLRGSLHRWDVSDWPSSPSPTLRKGGDAVQKTQVVDCVFRTVEGSSSQGREGASVVGLLLVKTAQHLLNTFATNASAPASTTWMAERRGEDVKRAPRSAQKGDSSHPL